MAIVIGLLLGFLLPFQTSMNTRLSIATKSPLVSTFYAFAIGIIPTLGIVMILNHPIVLSFDLVFTQPLWVFGGAILGIIYIFGNILILSKIGITQTSLLPLIGQFITSLTIDHFGLFYIPQHPVTLSKIVGIILLTIGVSGVVLTSSIKNKHTQNVLPYQLLAVFIGAVGSIQNAINSHFGVLVQSSLTATFYNFIIGALILLFVIILKQEKLLLSKEIITNSPVWMWFGAFIGIAFVMGTTIIALDIGTSMVAITTLLGLTVGSLLISQYGLLNNTRKPITLSQFVWLSLAIIGVFVSQFL